MKKKSLWNIVGSICSLRYKVKKDGEEEMRKWLKIGNENENKKSNIDDK